MINGSLIKGCISSYSFVNITLSFSFFTDTSLNRSYQDTNSSNLKTNRYNLSNLDRISITKAGQKCIHCDTFMDVNQNIESHLCPKAEEYIENSTCYICDTKHASTYATFR